MAGPRAISTGVAVCMPTRGCPHSLPHSPPRMPHFYSASRIPCRFGPPAGDYTLLKIDGPRWPTQAERPKREVPDLYSSAPQFQFFFVRQSNLDLRKPESNLLLVICSMKSIHPIYLETVGSSAGGLHPNDLKTALSSFRRSPNAPRSFKKEPTGSRQGLWG